MAEARVSSDGGALGAWAPGPHAGGQAWFGALRQRVRRWVGRPRPLLLTADGLWDPASAAVPYADFGAWCAAHRGVACELWLSAGLLSEVMGPSVGSGSELRGAAARKAWVRRVLFHYHGEAAVSWPLLPWQSAGAWGSTALRGPSLAGLQAQAREQGVMLGAVRPLWPRLLMQWQAHADSRKGSAPAEAWLVEAVPSPGGVAHLTRVKLVQGRIASLQRRRLQAPWATALQRLLDEEAAVPPPWRQLLWLGPVPDGPLPLQAALTLAPPFSEALPQARGAGPDFLRPEARPGPLAWAWLATCAAVLALAGGEARQAWALRAQAQAVVPAVEGPRAAPAVAAFDPAMQALQQRLRHPWHAVFLASELPTSAGLRWLSLDHRAGAELRLQGLASDAAPVQRLAAALRQQPDWRQVLVARLEVQAAPQAGLATGAAAVARPPLGTANPDPLLNNAFEIVAQLREGVAP